MANNNDLIPMAPKTFDSAPFTKQSSRLEVAGAAFQSSWKMAETSSLFRMLDHSQAEREDDVTDHLTLNDEYRLPTPLNEPMSRNKFNQLVEEDQDRKRLQEIITRGSDDFGNKAIAFTAGLAAQAVDPIALGLGIGTGTIFTTMAAKGLLGARGIKAAAQASVTGKRIGGLGSRIAEGVAGNVIGEVALVVPAALQEQQKINVFDNVRNAIAGGIAFPFVMKGLGFGLQKVSNLINLTAGRMDAGKRPFGDMTELEFATGVIRSNIDSEIKARIDSNISRKEQMLKGDKSPELQEAFKQAQDEIAQLEAQKVKMDAEIADTKGMRERANSEEQDLYHNEELNQEVKDFNDAKGKGRLNQDDISAIESKRLDEEYKILEKETLGDEAKLKVKEEIAAHKKMKEDLPEAMENFKKCEE